MPELYMWAEYARTREGFSELKELLSGGELDDIERSSKALGTGVR